MVSVTTVRVPGSDADGCLMAATPKERSIRDAYPSSSLCASALSLHASSGLRGSCQTCEQGLSEMRGHNQEFLHGWKLRRAVRPTIPEVGTDHAAIHIVRARITCLYIGIRL